MLLIACCLCSVSAMAQNRSSISGTVYDRKSGLPIPYATVFIGHKGTGTDGKGRYELKGVSRNLTLLNVSCVGYEKAVQPVDLTEADTFTFDFYLQESKCSLDEVVVTGTRTEKRLSNTPILTKVISEEDIVQAGSVTALDVLQDVMPGIQFKPDAHGANMAIQGLDNDYVLVLVDGKRLVGETRGNVNFDRIMAADIKQIEIVGGASSVLYGSNAIGGVINIITKKPETPLEGRVQSRYSRFNTWNSNVNLGFADDRWSLRLNGFRNSADGFDLTPETPESFTALPYTDYSGGANLSCRLSQRFTLKARGSYFRHETFNPPASLSSVHGRHINHTLGAELVCTLNDHHTLSMGTHTDKYAAFAIYEKKNDSTDLSSDYRYTSFDLTDRYRFGKKLEWVNGGELNLENVYSQSLFGFEAPQDEKHKRVHDFNLFSQADWKVGKKSEIVGGVRYTHHATFGSHFTPKLSAMYAPGKFKFRGTAALGYKSPSLKELYYNFNHQGMFWIIGNRDLKPENSRYASLSGEYTNGTFNASVNVYYNRIDNKIASVLVKNEVEKRNEYHQRNIDKAAIKGVESYLNWQFMNHFRLRAGYAFTDAVDLSSGEQILGSSKHTATASLTFFTRNVRYPLSLTFSGRYASASPILEVTKDEKGNEVRKIRASHPYSVWKINYLQHIPLWKRFSADLQVGVDNLFDFNEKKSTLIDPGRRFWGSLSLNF